MAVIRSQAQVAGREPDTDAAAEAGGPGRDRLARTSQYWVGRKWASPTALPTCC